MRLGWVWAIVLCFCLQCSAWAQESAPDKNVSVEPPAFVSQWFVGPQFKREALGFDSVLQQTLPGESWLGLAVFHRQDPWFGTGGALLFSQQDSAMEIEIDARWFLPLPLIEPYLGAQLNYLTREFGGFSIALRPGAQLQLLPQLYLDVFGQLRYDLFNFLFGAGKRGDQLLFGLGIAVLYKL
jgi:hypothetical protein